MSTSFSEPLNSGKYLSRRYTSEVLPLGAGPRSGSRHQDVGRFRRLLNSAAYMGDWRFTMQPRVREFRLHEGTCATSGTYIGAETFRTLMITREGAQRGSVITSLSLHAVEESAKYIGHCIDNVGNSLSNPKCS